MILISGATYNLKKMSEQDFLEERHKRDCDFEFDQLMQLIVRLKNSIRDMMRRLPRMQRLPPDLVQLQEEYAQLSNNNIRAFQELQRIQRTVQDELQSRQQRKMRYFGRMISIQSLIKELHLLRRIQAEVLAMLNE